MDKANETAHPPVMPPTRNINGRQSKAASLSSQHKLLEITSQQLNLSAVL